jgi:hypothetical protein
VLQSELEAQRSSVISLKDELAAVNVQRESEVGAAVAAARIAEQAAQSASAECELLKNNASALREAAAAAQSSFHAQLQDAQDQLMVRLAAVHARHVSPPRCPSRHLAFELGGQVLSLCLHLF